MGDQKISIESAALELMEGDYEAAQNWLDATRDILGGLSPRVYAQKYGEEDVIELIGRLRHCSFS